MSDSGGRVRIDTLCLGSDGQLADLVKIPAGGSRNPATEATVDQRLHYFQMSGNEVFKHAVRRMSAAARECLAKAGLEETDVSWLFPIRQISGLLMRLQKILIFRKRRFIKQCTNMEIRRPLALQLLYMN